MTRADIIDDYLMWDNLEAGTWTEAKTTSPVTRNVARLKRRNPTYKEMAASNGVVTMSDIVILLPMQEIASGASDPKPRDTFTLGSDSWTVLEAQLNTWRTWWRLVCRNFKIAENLCDTINVLSPAIGQDAAGAAVLGSFTTVWEEIPARIQREGSGVDGTTLDKRGSPEKYTVYTASQIEAAPYLRIEEVGGEGRILQVVRTVNPERITDLMSMECEIVR